MTLHELKSTLQNHLTDGLVIVVGSGLSCAEGLPGMSELAEHLRMKLPEHLSADDLAIWEELAASIQVVGLEAALLMHQTPAAIECAITKETARLIVEGERKVIQEVFDGVRTLRLTRLIPHLVKPSSGIPIITTNYDRLIEIAVEEAGLGADNMFVGRFVAILDENKSQSSFCRGIDYKQRRALLSYAPRAMVFKPHGSLDWYARNGRPVQFAGDLPHATRLMITPGANKFRSGYDSPFDRHRERANGAIDRGSRFLILGYGFNDVHLETHLVRAIRDGKPTLLITHTLTENAQRLTQENPHVIALVWDNQNGIDGTKAISGGGTTFFEQLTIWDVNSFVSEVLL